MNSDPVSIATQVQDEHRDALKTYGDLLILPSLDESQQEALRSAIRLLRKTTDQVRADHSAVVRVLELRRKIAHARSDEVVKQEEEARIACKEWAEETRLILAERNEKYGQLLIAQQDVQQIMMDAENRLTNELRVLEHQNWQLLGIRQPRLLQGNEGHRVQ